MRVNCKYMPVLRGKQGEIHALTRLAADVKTAILPLLDIDESPSTEKKPFEKHLDLTVGNLARAWGKEYEVIIDTDRINSDQTLTSGEHYLAHICEHVQKSELNAIMTCSLDRLDSQSYLNAVLQDRPRSNGRLCVRVFDHHIVQSEDEFGSRVKALLASVGSKRELCDLVIDLQVVNLDTFDNLLEEVTKFLSSARSVSDWKCLFLVASSFPNTLKGIKADTITKFPRHDLKLWQSITTTKNKPRRIPIFGDYGIVSALFTDQPDFRIANIPTKIRYATDENWIIVKGGTTKKHGFDYFRKLAKQVVQLGDYKGEGFSWGR
jgi:Beta protein